MYPGQSSLYYIDIMYVCMTGLISYGLTVGKYMNVCNVPLVRTPLVHLLSQLNAIIQVRG